MAKKGIGVELGTIIVTAFAVFLWVAIFSYHTQDSSFFTQSTQPISNACGKVGAYFASFFLQFFGLAAFLIPVGFLFVSSNLHSEEGFFKSLLTVMGIGISVISLTIFLSLHWQTWHWSETEFLTGGISGTWLSVPLLGFLNRTGASIASIAIFFVALVLSTPIEVSHFLSGLIRALAKVSIRLGRLAITYGAYYAAIGLNKLAQFIGIQAKKSFEQIKERADAYRVTRLARIEARIEKTEAALLSEEFDHEPRIDFRTNSNKESNNDSTTDFSKQYSTETETDTQTQTEPNPAPVQVQSSPSSSSSGPIIEKAIAAPLEPIQQKFKFDKKRGKWKLPLVDFLRKVTRVETAIDRDRLTERARLVSDKLAEFGIDGEVTSMRVGPVITLYEFKPGPGIKVSRIAGLVEDLAMALSSKSVRILAPLPGKAVVGIEIPSEVREQVLLREFLQTGEFQNPRYQIPTVMGKDIAGQSIFADLAKMPHLLVSGQTGSGKSVFMNSLICSLIYRFTPDELRLILVDPKFIEFSFYHDIPHLLLPVVDDPKNASSALKWAVREMERRYRILEAAGVRNLQSYNEKVEALGAETMADILQAEAKAQEEIGSTMTGGDWIEVFEKDESGSPVIGKMPYIVIIIDELADLMMTVKKDVEVSIARISQKARASGIHLVIATQRPSTDVITGLIKANMPTRVSFSLSSQIDSRTILDRPGAERLLGQGDMLFIPPGSNEPIRLQGAFIDDNELTKITDFLREQGKPVYRNEILLDPEEFEMDDDDEDRDPLYDQALGIVRDSKTASASFLQRRLQIGYNRAARLIESMEAKGIVGPADGARPREILLP